MGIAQPASCARLARRWGDRSKGLLQSANSPARCDRHRPPRRIGYARRCRQKSRLAHEVRSRNSEPSCAVASKRSCDLILTRQFALSHFPKPAPHRRSFFIIEMVDTNIAEQRGELRQEFDELMSTMRIASIRGRGGSALMRCGGSPDWTHRQNFFSAETRTLR